MSNPQLIVSTGHTASVSAVAFHPNGKHILTASQDSTLIYWEKSGRKIKTLDTGGAINAIDISYEGTYILAAGRGGATVWDTGNLDHEPEILTNDLIMFAQFSPDGKYIFTEDRHKRITLWRKEGNTFTGSHVFYHQLSDEYKTITFTADSNHFLIGTRDGVCHIINIGDLIAATDPININQIDKISFPTTQTEFPAGRRLTSVAVSPNGDYFLSSAYNKQVKLWDINSPEQEVAVLPFDFPLTAAAFSPDGTKVLVGGYDPQKDYHGLLRIWDTQNPTQDPIEFSHDSAVYAVAFSSDGNHVISGGKNNDTTLWDIYGKKIHTFKGGADINDLAISPEGARLAIASGDHRVKLWDLQKNRLSYHQEHTDKVVTVAYSPGEDKVLSGSADHTFILWDLENEGSQGERHEKGITSVAYGPGADHILTGSEDYTAALWQIYPEFELKHRFSDPEIRTKVGTVAISPIKGDEVLLISYGSQARLHKWDQNTPETTYGSGQETINAAIFSHSGTHVLIGTRNPLHQNGSIKLYNRDGTEAQPHTFESNNGHTDGISALAFSSDDNYILSGSYDGSAILWETETGNIITHYRGHTNRITSVGFLQNPKDASSPFVVSCSLDGTIKIWEMANGDEIVTLIPIDKEDWAVISPSGLFDATSGAFKSMHFVIGTESVALEQLKERYYEPYLLPKLLGWQEQYLRNVDAFSELDLYPEIQNAIITTTGDSRGIGFLVFDLVPRSGGIGKVSLFFDDKEVAEDINPDRKTTDIRIDLKLEKYRKYLNQGHKTSIILRPYNETGWLKGPPTVLNFWGIFGRPAGTPPNSDDEIVELPDPHLYAIVVGTSIYRSLDPDFPSSLNLLYPDHDAIKMASVLQMLGANLFQDRLTVKLLTSSYNDGHTVANKSNIQEAFNEVIRDAESQDIILAYFSGHGTNYVTENESLFYYLTRDVSSSSLTDDGVRNQYMVSSRELVDWLTQIAAEKQVLLIDACHSGQIIDSVLGEDKNLDAARRRAVERMKDRTGTYVLTGSAADKVSYEAVPYGQGLLTYSLLNGMRGPGLREEGIHKYVDVSLLLQHARDEVPRLAAFLDQEQIPEIAFPDGGADFSIGIKEESNTIELAEPKKIYIRSVFLNRHQFNDSLNLSSLLNERLREEAEQSDAEFVYVGISTFNEAYRIRGLYEIIENEEEEVVKLSMRRFKGLEAEPDSITEIEHPKADIPGLIDAIVNVIEAEFSVSENPEIRTLNIRNRPSFPDGRASFGR